MTVERPTGGYMGQMTLPPTAWPEVNEDDHIMRAGELNATQTQLRDRIAQWKTTQTRIFDGHTWFGQASIAGEANSEATPIRCNRLTIC